MNIITRAFLTPKVHEMVHPSEETQRAIDSGQPITLIDLIPLVMRVPEDRIEQCVKSVVDTVRSHGAVPVFAVMKSGRICLEHSVKAALSIAVLSKVLIASRAQLPFVIAEGGDAVPDASLLMVIAELAGIRCIATTSLDGVRRPHIHRRSERHAEPLTSFACELARTTVAVVCSGFCVFDDPGESLEVVERFAVPVAGFRTSRLPLQCVRDSGLSLSNVSTTPQQCAEAMHYMWRLGLSGGMLFLNPIQAEYAVSPEDLMTWLTAVVPSAADRGEQAGRQRAVCQDKRWKDLMEKSDGRTVDAECELMRSNASLAAEIAVAFST